MKMFSFLCIIVGALLIFLFDDKSSYDGYMKILGFALLMFGLYRSTKLWVKDNPKEEQDKTTKPLDEELDGDEK